MKRILLLLFCVTCFGVVRGQDIIPYLQAPTPNSIYVNWISDSAGVPSINYGLSSGMLSSTVTGTQSYLVDGGNSYYYNTVRITNLNPNTKYYYSAGLGTMHSDTTGFKTLPNPGQAASADGHIRFLIMGDNQIKTTGRYDTLVTQARRKVIEKYSGDPEDHIELTFMVGDQVDLGNLDQYRNIHFAYNEALSPNVPIQTTVGNHETYGSMGMTAYYEHFYLQQMSYRGVSSGTENYYAMQAGNVLFISLSSEHTGTVQYDWLNEVLDSADADPTVDWILTFSHRPYEAEQYVGDISPWVKNSAVPLCMNYPKYFMHVGAHHHIYSRGQFAEGPVYNIISGGTAWDQFWGQSAESDFSYIQKTIPNWCYQIVDVDVVNEKIDVECYSVGSPIMFANNQWKENQLVDEFHRYLNQPAPDQPSIVTVIPDSLQLPFTFTSSAYSSSTAELLNTTQFQVSGTSDFSIIEAELLRDYENLYGQASGQTADSTMDQNAGVNILEYEIPSGGLSNGRHYLRVRHRDRNLEWSNWSVVDSFLVYNSFSSGPMVQMDKDEYALGTPLVASYSNGPGNSTDWIGLYRDHHVPGNNSSTTWSYCSGTGGTIQFAGNALTVSDIYYAAFFELDGYTEIAPRDTFYYGMIPTISSDTNEYPVGQPIDIYVNDAPVVADSLEVIKVGYLHGVHPSELWTKVNSSSDTFTLSNLPKGYYTVRYYFEGQTRIGEAYYFSVGDTITNLSIDKTIYELGEDIVATWTDAPGIVKDWLGIYHSNDDPNVDPLLSYSYFDGVAHGSKAIKDTLLPADTGRYFIVMFTDDSYTEVSNREYFEVIDPTIGIHEVDAGLKVYPNPVSGSQFTVFSSDYPIESIQLLDATGRVVYRTENVRDMRYSILVEQLPEGIYTVELQTRKLYRYKLVIR